MAAPKASTKQREAMNVMWTAIIVISSVASVVSQHLNTAPAEKEGLLSFRRALRDQSRLLSSWVESTDPCVDRWTGVFCVTEDAPANVDPNFQHVTEVRLLKMNLGGALVPELGNLTALKYFDVIGNSLTGKIPRELGKLSNLFALTLSLNKITGSMPDELGNLINLNRLQLDENQISGALPSTLSKLVNLQHMHLNNNSIEGSIPKQIGQIPLLVHILLDNNRMNGSLPVEISNISNLVILQLDNNNFEGGIPPEYGNWTKLTKLSCRNCGLSGTIPDLSRLSHLVVLDLSSNSFRGNIPSLTNVNISSIDLSKNELNGVIPDQFQLFSTLQSLKLANNKLEGPIPEFTSVEHSKFTIVLDFQNNTFSFVSLPLVSTAARKPTFQLRLSGNVEICEGLDAILEISFICKPVLYDTLSQFGTGEKPRGGPILVTYRLKSPGFVFFEYYEDSFIDYIAHGLLIDKSQVTIRSWHWQPGPRLEMVLVIHPSYGNLNQSEIDRIGDLFAHWEVKSSTVYGPYELLGFSRFEDDAGLSAGGIAGIVLGSAALLAFVVLGTFLLRTLRKRWRMSPAEKRRQRMLSRTPTQIMLRIKGVQAYTYKEMEKATDGFSQANLVGEGGYGKVFRGRLEDGTIVAIKKAEEAAIQRNTEFYNEIELLSRCHHRNLVALIGFCNDEEEQMLVYEFMEGGTLHDNLNSGGSTKLDFEHRLRIALGSARGILYLHTEADPPIYHRDIKARNILLNNKGEAKVADFGLSRLAPLPDLEGVVMTHVSTVVKGTPGYLDPEYFLTNQLTDKSDVYSFGVVLLELVTGMQPISGGKNIVREVKQAHDKGDLATVVDTKMGSYAWEIVEQFAKLAISCVASETGLRPPMQEVCRVLEGLMNNLSAHMGMSTSSIRSLDISRDICRSAEFPLEALESGSLQNSQHQKGTSELANSSTYRTTISVEMPHAKDVAPR